MIGRIGGHRLVRPASSQCSSCSSLRRRRQRRPRTVQRWSGREVGECGRERLQWQMVLASRTAGASQPLLGQRCLVMMRVLRCRRRLLLNPLLVSGIACGRWTAPMQTWRRALGSCCASRPPTKSRWRSPLSRRCGSLPPPSRGSPPQAATTCTRSTSGASRIRRCSC